MDDAISIEWRLIKCHINVQIGKNYIKLESTLGVSQLFIVFCKFIGCNESCKLGTGLISIDKYSRDPSELLYTMYYCIN